MIVAFKIIGVLLGLLLLYVAYHNAYLPVAPDSTKRIIFVPGVQTDPYYLRFWRSYLERTAPKASVEFLEGYYTYQSPQEVIQKRDELAELITSASLEHLRFVTHSYGGVLLVSALHELEKQGVEVSYEKVVTLASPLAPDEAFFDQEFFTSRRALDFYDAPELNTHTPVCGVFDSLVNCTRAVYTAQKPIRVLSSHVTFMVPQLFGGRTVLKYLYE